MVGKVSSSYCLQKFCGRVKEFESTFSNALKSGLRLLCIVCYSILKEVVVSIGSGLLIC